MFIFVKRIYGEDSHGLQKMTTTLYSIYLTLAALAHWLGIVDLIIATDSRGVHRFHATSRCRYRLPSTRPSLNIMYSDK